MELQKSSCIGFGVGCPLALWGVLVLFLLWIFYLCPKKKKTKKKLGIIWEFGGVFGMLESSHQLQINKVDFIFFRPS